MSASSGFDLKELTRRRAAGKLPGIYSVCSAHHRVLEAAMRGALSDDAPLLIEATCNQVNQFGGYTGMTPAAFRTFVESIAARVQFPLDRLLLGGDHLGPHPWRSLPAQEAMKNARELVAVFVAAGFTKIHLDTSMACADDATPLPDEVIAERAAALAVVAEKDAARDGLRYVIGTEVPTPGGAVEELAVSVTKYEDAERALLLHRSAFHAAGIPHAWERVVALVTQPGVEFGHENVVDYDSAKAAALCSLLRKHPEIVFEAHSTDYQRPEVYGQLVRDGFAILKVGPALTFAMRQALFALEVVEAAVVPEGERSNLKNTALAVMKAHPGDWKQHYHGDAATVERLMVHSYSDRIRYYWHYPEIEAAVRKLIGNLEGRAIPETLLCDFLPRQYERVREGLLEKAPAAIVLDQIRGMLEPYVLACKQARNLD